MNVLIQEICELLKDYRSDESNETVRVTPERIRIWISQFNEEDKVFILNELKHVFKKSYCSKERVIWFLKRMIEKLSNDLGYSNQQDFFDNACFLDLQAEGKSQQKMLELLAVILKKEYNYELSNLGNKAKKHYVYIDDVLCTGNTFYRNIEKWLATEENGVKMIQKLKNNDIHLKVVYIFMVLESYHKKLGQFYHKGYDFENLHTAYALFRLNTELLQPIEGISADLITTYQTKVVQQADEHAQGKYRYEPKFYRVVSPDTTENFYSSYENRIRFENILLKKGIEILNHSNTVKNNIRPLGYSLPSHKNFGFGAMLFTWRNVPNNTPIVFWYRGGGFTPLFDNQR